MNYTVLKQIYCDKFQINGKPRGPINFKEGLNVVLGGESGTNSIGKSTFLMILDFVFGGKDYVKKDTDVQKNVGSHIIKFIFEFNNQEYYFSRSTKNFLSVNVCNEKFEPQKDKQMTLEEYLGFLAKNYGLNLPGLSFRNAVGRFIRVYNRQTINEKKPLQNATQEAGKQQVYGLLKLFNKYASIEEREIAAEKAEKAYSVFKNASQYKYVPIVSSKKQYDKNVSEIARLEEQLKELETKNNEGTLNIDDMQASRLRDIMSNLSKLRERRNLYLNRLSVIDDNEKSGPKKLETNYKELKKFFPDVDMEMIRKVDGFHQQITNILENEFSEEKKSLNNKIKDIDYFISSLNSEAQKINNQQAPNIQTALLNEYADKMAKLNQLKNENKNYNEKLRLNNDKQSQQNVLRSTVNTELKEVESSLNKKMADLNTEICGSNSFQPPHIELGPKQYSYETINDQGTGTSYKGLILFDQACLELTALPFFIHDSLLFSNIEVNRKNKIIKMYSNETKQIFIAIDTTDLLSPDVQHIIEEHSVLRLERGGKELFGRSWNEQRSS